MMRFIRKVLGPSRHERVDLRRLGNVVADAVEAAKGQEIDKARAELAEARNAGKQARVQVNLASRAVATLHRTVTAAGERAEEVISRGLGDD